MSEPFHRTGGWLHAEAVPLTRIAEKVGTPVYVYSATTIAERYAALAAAFAGDEMAEIGEPGFQLAYARAVGQKIAAQRLAAIGKEDLEFFEDIMMWWEGAKHLRTRPHFDQGHRGDAETIIKKFQQ